MVRYLWDWNLERYHAVFLKSPIGKKIRKNDNFGTFWKAKKCRINKEFCLFEKVKNKTNLTSRIQNQKSSQNREQYYFIWNKIILIVNN